MSIIATHDLFVSLGRLPILRSVNISVSAGEAVALLGANGSGKTTLVRAILGLIPAQLGEITLFGTPLQKFSQWQKVGYVPQRAAIRYPQATVQEVVEMGLLGKRHLFRPLQKSERKKIDQSLEQVDLLSRANTPYHWLSGGQQQRVLIARALAGNAEALIMDEPLAGMDLHSQARLAKILAALKSQGIGQLIVLHETDQLEALLDREIVLRDGKVLPPGTKHHDHHHHEEAERTPLLHGSLDRG